MLGVKMLEYSIKKHASLSVVVEPIDDAGIPVPADPANRSRTGFSFSRFKIPGGCVDIADEVSTWTRTCRYSPTSSTCGRARSTGPGFFTQRDRLPKGRIPQFSVLLLDCANLDWDVKKIVNGFDQGRYNYADLMQKLCIVDPEHKRGGLPFEWNSLECYEPGKTNLIHYTDMPTQPWVSANNQNESCSMTRARRWRWVPGCGLRLRGTCQGAHFARFPRLGRAAPACKPG